MMHKGVIVLIVACALVGLAGAAANDITQGGVIFIGEQGLNVSGFLNAGDQVEWFASGANPSLDAPSATLTIGDSNNLYVSPADFTGKTGNWYNVNHSVVFNVVEPSLIIKPWSDSSTIDITGKSVPAGEKVDFRIETNLYSIQQRDPTSTFDFKVKVTSPDGAIFTALASSSGTNLNLTGIPVSSSLFYVANQNPTLAWDTGAKDISNNRIYKAGTYSVSAECNANKIKDNYPEDGKTIASVKSISIASDTLIISTNKDTVTRGQQFAVTISGLPSTTYKLFIKNPDSTAGDTTPIIVDSQEGVTPAGNTYTANVLLSTSGSRTVGFRTDVNTKDKTYTIRVEDSTAQKSDEVTVKVQAGKVTVVASGSGTYYIGDEITFSGTNTETDTVYLFITGPNLPSSGGKLSDPRSPVTTGNAGTFAQANVLEDNTWEYKYDTTGISVDSGSYTIYAVAEPDGKEALSNTKYDTASVRLSKPLITAFADRTTIAKGDEFHITGNAGDQPSNGLELWVFGKNHFRQDTISVESDGTYDYLFSRGDTDLATGQYYVVIQHPMYNGIFDVYLDPTGDKVIGSYPSADPLQNVKFLIAGPGSLQGSDAANALNNAIDDPSVDDISATVQFTIAEPDISLTSIPDTQVGKEIIVSGATNLAVDEDILIEILSSSFVPTQKTQSGEFSGYSTTVQVQAGSGSINIFNTTVNTSSFKPDEYVVTASGILTSATGTTTFNVVEFIPTTIPTTVPPTPTPVKTPVVNTTPTQKVNTTVVTTAPPISIPTTESPGFGSVIALIGIGLVGWMVMRKER